MLAGKPESPRPGGPVRQSQRARAWGAPQAQGVPRAQGVPQAGEAAKSSPSDARQRQARRRTPAAGRASGGACGGLSPSGGTTLTLSALKKVRLGRIQFQIQIQIQIKIKNRLKSYQIQIKSGGPWTAPVPDY